ncbi:MAG: hypothetical protein R2776_06280 [Flavobacteriaceae bacterium]
MKTYLSISLFIIFIVSASSQNLTKKSEVEKIFKETLLKSRDYVKTATNEWRYDNTKEDYFINDTIILNSARSYRQSNCKEVSWSFFDLSKLTIDIIPECTEPPTKLTGNKNEYLEIDLRQENSRTLIYLFSEEFIEDKFEVLSLVENEPIDNELNSFDYTLKLLRIK